MSWATVISISSNTLNVYTNKWYNLDWDRVPREERKKVHEAVKNVEMKKAEARIKKIREDTVKENPPVLCIPEEIMANDDAWEERTRREYKKCRSLGEMMDKYIDWKHNKCPRNNTDRVAVNRRGLMYLVHKQMKGKRIEHCTRCTRIIESLFIKGRHAGGQLGSAAVYAKAHFISESLMRWATMNTHVYSMFFRDGYIGYCGVVMSEGQLRKLKDVLCLVKTKAKTIGGKEILELRDDHFIEQMGIKHESSWGWLGQKEKFGRHRPVGLVKRELIDGLEAFKRLGLHREADHGH
jgi:hypothetical protein